MEAPPVTSRPSGRILAALAAITAAGCAWRLVGLELESLWYDEAISLDLARRPFAEIWANRALDGHPPLYFLLLRVWTWVFGDSVAGIRGLSVVPGTLTIPLVYALTARGRGPLAGLVAAGLAAGSSFLAFYSREARDYAWLLFFGTAAFWALDRAIERPTPGRLALWSGTLTLSLWSSGFGASILATHVLLLVGLAVAAFRGGARPARPLLSVLPWVVAAGAAVLIYAPWIAVLSGAKGAVAQRRWAVPNAGLPELWRTLVAFGGTRRGLAILAPFALLGLWREFARPGKDPWRAPLLASWLLGPLLLPWLASQVSHPFYVGRGTLVSIGGFAALAAGGIDFLRPRLALHVAAIGLAALAVVFGVQRDRDRVEREDWRSLVGQLCSRAHAGDFVLLKDRFEITAFSVYATRDDLVLANHETAADPAAPWGERRDVWFVESPHTRRVPETRTALAQAGFRASLGIEFRKMRLERWER